MSEPISEKQLGNKPWISYAVGAALIVSPIIFAFPVLFNGRTLLPPGDIGGGLFDARILIGKILSNGQLPLWNPYPQAGIPLIAVAHAGALNPLNWIFVFFSPVAAVNILAIITNQLALVGCYLYARRINISRPAAVIVSALYALAAMNILPTVYIGDSATVMTAAWTPWIMLALENLYQRAEWRWVGLGSVFLSLQFFAGDIQISFYAFLLSIGYICYSRICRESSAGFLTAATAMLLCGALLSMVQLLPVRESFMMGNNDQFLKGLLPGHKVSSGLYPVAIYICALTTLSILVGLYAKRFSSLFWLWLSVSIISVTLGQLPTQLHEEVFGWIPMYGLFPSPAGQLYFSAFATAVLCGFAFTGLSRENLKINSQSNPSRWVVALAGGIIITAPVLSVLLVALNGTPASNIDSRLALPDAIKFIISREKGTKDFRVINLTGTLGVAGAALPREDGNSPVASPAHELRIINSPEQISQPNLSAVAGDLRKDGAIGDRNLLMSYHQGLNLLNVKYLLLADKKPGSVEQSSDLLNVNGINFNRDRLGINLRGGNKISVTTEAGIVASEIALISHMKFSEQVADDTAVCVVRLHTKKGEVLIREMRAGKDTAEWSYDKPEIRHVIKHKKARVAVSEPSDDFARYDYIATLKFGRTEVNKIEFEYINPQSQLGIHHVSLHDSETGMSVPVTSRDLIDDRWRKIGQFEHAGVYENRATTSRAWFVDRVEAVSGPEMPEIIRSGAMPDGTLFDPRETALIDRMELTRNNATSPPISHRDGATVTIDYSDTTRIELTAQNINQGFLVLSEPYFRGWDAFVDGKRKPVSRVNYVLQGIPVSAGKHKIDFKYRSPAVHNGAFYTLLGILILIAGPFVGRQGPGRVYSRVKSIFPSAGLDNSVVSYLRSLYACLQSLYGKLSAGHVLSRLFIIVSSAGIFYYLLLMIRYASKAVTGNDSYGYASLAKYIAQLSVAQPIVELSQFDLPPEFSNVFVPITYTSEGRPGFMLPVYPPGQPLLIAAFSSLFGWEVGPFIVGPASATVSSIFTYLIARELGLSRRLSAAAGFMLALSPIVVFMGLQIVSDVPSMMFDLVAVYASLVCRRKTRWAWIAGMAFGFAVLIRPTNVFMLIPIIFCLPFNMRVLIHFALGGLPLAIFQCIYSLSIYGDPFHLGYGNPFYMSQGSVLFNLFDLSFSFMFTRFQYYIYWIARLMSPLILLGWLGTVFNRKLSWRDRAFLISWFGSFILLYCSYSYYNDWWFTRFLLPGWPALIIGSLITAKYIGEMLDKHVRHVRGNSNSLVSRIPLLGLIILVVAFSIHNIRSFNMSSIQIGAQQEKDIVIWGIKQIPSNSLTISGYWSGMLKYYGGLNIVNHSEMNEARWNILKEKVRSKGSSIYALLLPHEVALAQKNIPGEWSLLGSYEDQTLWRVATE